MIPPLFSMDLPVGVCSFEAVSAHLLPCRRKVLLPKDAKSILVVLFPYYLGEEAYAEANISRYAVPADYHDIVGAMLDEACARLRAYWPQHQFIPFCDNSPIPEVYAAAKAGLGVIGKNGLLIHPRYGSFCFIGEVVTDLALSPTGDAIRTCCGCGRCENSCPAGALLGGSVAKAHCLSAVTQQKQELTEAQRLQILQSGCVWGCDICQTVCPQNQNAEKTPIAAFYQTAIPYIAADTPIDGRAFAWRGERVIRRNLAIFEKNEPDKNANRRED